MMTKSENACPFIRCRNILHFPDVLIGQVDCLSLFKTNCKYYSTVFSMNFNTIYNILYMLNNVRFIVCHPVNNFQHFVVLFSVNFNTSYILCTCTENLQMHVNLSDVENPPFNKHLNMCRFNVCQPSNSISNTSVLLFFYEL